MSVNWNHRASSSILHGALTNSKRPACFIRGVYPTHVSRGNGCFLWDSRGKRYVDYIFGLGSNLYGYANHEINQAIKAQLDKGSIYSLSSTLEVEAAEALKEEVPFIRLLRFLKGGTAACNAAVKIARAVTKRNEILTEGYHGWGDEFVSISPPGHGIPPQSHIKKLIDLEQISESTACVIVEPIITDFSHARIDWLNKLKEKCNKTGALLIFDEVITGFRWPSRTVSQYYGIAPDIICLGKALGGGVDISIVGLNEKTSIVANEIEWFISGTFFGDTLGFAALKKVIELQRSKFNINKLWDQGHNFIMRFNDAMNGLVYIEGYSTRGVFKAKDDLTKALFFQEAVKAGLLFGPSFFYNYCHHEQDDFTLSTCKDIAVRIKSGMVNLEGEMPSTPFAQKIRSN